MWQPYKAAPYIARSVVYIFILVLCDQQKYSEKSENMIGLDSYIQNSLNYLNLIWIYINHCLTSLLKLEITVLCGFHCQFIQGHWRGMIIRNRSVWPTLFLLNVFTALKRTHFYILFVVNTAVVVLCGDPKNQSRKASVVFSGRENVSVVVSPFDSLTFSCMKPSLSILTRPAPSSVHASVASSQLFLLSGLFILNK